MQRCSSHGESGLPSLLTDQRVSFAVVDGGPLSCRCVLRWWCGSVDAQLIAVPCTARRVRGRVGTGGEWSGCVYVMAHQ